MRYIKTKLVFVLFVILNACVTSNHRAQIVIQKECVNRKTVTFLFKNNERVEWDENEKKFFLKFMHDNFCSDEKSKFTTYEFELIYQTPQRSILTNAWSLLSMATFGFIPAYNEENRLLKLTAKNETKQINLQTDYKLSKFFSIFALPALPFYDSENTILYKTSLELLQEAERE